MRKFLFLFYTLFISATLFAQLEVKPGSFKEVAGFVNINLDKQTDDNDRPYAVVKVKTENISDKQRRELLFEGDGRTFIECEYKVGEVWLYISYYASYIKISHPDFSSTEIVLPFDMQPKKGYEMILVNKYNKDDKKDVYNYLIVKADQPNAVIYIDNEYVGEQEVYKSYKAGEKHNWRIECDLFYNETGEAVIPDKEGENMTIEKVLRPAFGYINVTSSPENGAVVFIDGKKVGQTPYKSERLTSGDHTVKVMKEMFFPAENIITVTDSNTIDAPMIMRPNFVSVSITTDSVSYIYVDNEKKGVGNWSGRLSEGSHSLEARKASHKTAIKNVQLILGKDETIVIPNPVPIYGTLDVVSDPIVANIIIDGKNYGTTPRVLTNVLIGKHELRLEKAGCAPVVKNITLDEKNKLTLNERLLTGREISISTDGTGDKIFVDGNYIGNSPLTATITYDEHKIYAIRVFNNDNISQDSMSGLKTNVQTIYVGATDTINSVKLSFDIEKLTFIIKGISFDMIAVHGGSFIMGCTSEQGDGCYPDELPTHKVTLSDYYIGQLEVSEKLWEAVMGNYPSDYPSNYINNDYERPVSHITWNDCQRFIDKLNKMTGQSFRLPTEAEWEYAARGGNKSKGYKCSGCNNIDESAINMGRISTKIPNELGVYDMNGSLHEYCQDWFGLYGGENQINPTGPISGDARVMRGDSWFNPSKDCRVSGPRYRSDPDKSFPGTTDGLRLALSPSVMLRDCGVTYYYNDKSATIGVFSVSPTKKVRFAKGNLQYQPSTNTWRFAEHQWDYIGEDNKNVSPTYDGWIDLFGWGTGNNPTIISKNSNDYIGFNDWGNNTISNGGGKSWFTLTTDEWVYLFNKRSTSSGIRYAIATVNGVNGVVLLPDNWNISNYNLNNTNNYNANFNSNYISQSDWTIKLEANGAIFLPAAGWRDGTNVFCVGSDGYYWSATYYNHSSGVYCVWFLDSHMYLMHYGNYRTSGRSVRPVTLAE